MGRGFDCGVYHPTGACIMGVLELRDTGSSFQFCWVCRYAMVDFIDPALHGVIDAGLRRQVSEVSDERGSLRVVADHLAQAVGPLDRVLRDPEAFAMTDGARRLGRRGARRQATPLWPTPRRKPCAAVGALADGAELAEVSR